jgi:DNA-binding GntR family transcriptional regulator
VKIGRHLKGIPDLFQGKNMCDNLIRCYNPGLHQPDAVSLRKTWEFHQINKSPFGQDSNFNIPPSLFKPIETSTAQEIIYGKLSEAIISCKIPPGTRLTTAEISKAFNVSHAPARVALNWLEAKGFIISKKKKASIVKELTIKELKEIITIRLILETAAVDHSIEVCTEETVELAGSISTQVEKARTLEEHDKLNTQFHLTLYRDAVMPLLMQMIEDVCNRISPYAILFNYARGISFDKNGPIELHHRGMLEGMRLRDREKVIKHLKLDLNKATPHIEELLEVADKYRYNS